MEVRGSDHGTDPHGVTGEAEEPMPSESRDEHNEGEEHTSRDGSGRKEQKNKKKDKEKEERKAKKDEKMRDAAAALHAGAVAFLTDASRFDAKACNKAVARWLLVYDPPKDRLPFYVLRALAAVLDAKTLSRPQLEILLPLRGKLVEKQSEDTSMVRLIEALDSLSCP